MRTAGIQDGVRWLDHVFPLRPDFVCTITLPRDLTTAEAERLAAMLRTLPLDSENEGGPALHPRDEGE